jgi:molybdopterin molybdotransferase
MPASPDSSKVLSFEEARHVVEAHARELASKGRELLSLLDAAGRVLAEPVRADRDFPPFPRATRDGYALRSADAQQTPATLTVIGEIRAGASSSQIGPIRQGEAVAIMTGAAVPEGADAVAMIEHSLRSGDRVEVNKVLSTGENVVPAGAEARRGDLLLSPGTRLDYASIALAAAVGRPRLLVCARPRIAVLSTGDEVVDVDVPLAAGQIRNSNSYSLATQVKSAGGDPVLLPIARDEPGRLRELLGEAFECDLALIAGGVSMGKYDLVEPQLAALEAEFLFTGAKIQPGRPIVFGRVPWSSGGTPSQHASAGHRVAESGVVPWKYFFGLPGNPVSTMVTFELFAKIMVEALAGFAPRKLAFHYAKLKTTIRTKTGLKRFLPARVSGEFENAEVELTAWQGSGDIAAAARSDCYLVIPADRERIDAGEWVAVLPR